MDPKIEVKHHHLLSSLVEDGIINDGNAMFPNQCFFLERTAIWKPESHSLLQDDSILYNPGLPCFSCTEY